MDLDAIITQVWKTVNKKCVYRTVWKKNMENFIKMRMAAYVIKFDKKNPIVLRYFLNSE